MNKPPLPKAVESNVLPVDLETPKRPWWKYLYDRETKKFCDRTCFSWLCILSYSVMYLLFLATFTIILLYLSLLIVKSRMTNAERYEYLAYRSGVGLTATPSGENSSPLIWYRKGEPRNYRKYVDALDKLVSTRKKRNVNSFKYLGPCGESPFGYGDAPCVIVRINKQWGWKVKPLQGSSLEREDIPSQVREWAKRDAKLWLHCGGYYPHDVEHIGYVKYYPDPPGIDHTVFPLDKNNESPLVAFQLSNFTLGVSIGVDCTLWYEEGESKVSFVFYVGASKKNGLT